MLAHRFKKMDQWNIIASSQINSKYSQWFLTKVQRGFIVQSVVFLLTGGAEKNRICKKRASFID